MAYWRYHRERENSEKFNACKKYQLYSNTLDYSAMEAAPELLDSSGYKSAISTMAEISNDHDLVMPATNSRSLARSKVDRYSILSKTHKTDWYSSLKTLPPDVNPHYCLARGHLGGHLVSGWLPGQALRTSIRAVILGKILETAAS